MTNQLTKLTTVKVIVGLLMMLIITPFIDFTPINESRIKGLELLRDQVVMLKEDCPTENNSTRCSQINTTELISELTMTYFNTFSSEDTGEILHFVVNGEEVYNVERTGEPLTGRECDCGFPVLDGLRLGPTPPPEIKLIALDDEDNAQYESTEDLQRYSNYVATFSDKNTQDTDAARSMLLTTFIIGLLIVGMIAFNNDARVISETITVPLSKIAVEMNNVARMNLTQKGIMKPSNVFEIRRMQASLLNMKKGIKSFGKFIPKNVVASMLKSGQEAKLGVMSRNITTFFSDIANFTTICESMKPSELLVLLTEYVSLSLSLSHTHFSSTCYYYTHKITTTTTTDTLIACHRSLSIQTEAFWTTSVMLF